MVSDRPSQKAPETATTAYQLELPTDTDRQTAPPHPEAENAEARPPLPSANSPAMTPVGRLPPQFEHRNARWADLLRHTFEVDVPECDRCGGRMKLVAMLTDPATIEAAHAKSRK